MKDFTYQHRKRLADSHRGATNPAWKGYNKSINELVRSSFKYRAWRNKIFKRDRFTCIKCKTKGTRLHVDHIIRFSKLMREFLATPGILGKTDTEIIRLSDDHQPFWDTSNGRTLCIECHTKHHKRSVVRPVMTKEAKYRIVSEVQRKRWQNKEQMKAIIFTPDARAKMSAALKGNRNAKRVEMKTCLVCGTEGKFYVCSTKCQNKLFNEKPLDFHRKKYIIK